MTFRIAPLMNDRPRLDLADTYVAPTLEIAFAFARAAWPFATGWTLLPEARR